MTRFRGALATENVAPPQLSVLLASTQPAKRGLTYRRFTQRLDASHFVTGSQTVQSHRFPFLVLFNERGPP